jgi:hypothetical protein
MFELLIFHTTNKFYVKKNIISLFFTNLTEKIQSIYQQVKGLSCYVFIHKYSRVFSFETGTVDVCLKCGKIKRENII